jgi:hypothetical protein
MKRIAFFVEGQTEQLFVERLLKEIASENAIGVELQVVRGGKRTMGRHSSLVRKSGADKAYAYYAMIYDCGGESDDVDGNRKSTIVSDIRDMQLGLAEKGYIEVIGLRDLYPIPLIDLAKLEHGLSRQLRQANLIPSSIVIAVREIEDWFLAECNHYTKIDTRLVLDATQIASLGFHPCVDDLTLREEEDENGGKRPIAAASDLNSVYQLVGKTYSKSKPTVERTIDCLDYANLYLEVSRKMPKLKELIDKIDNFLT